MGVGMGISEDLSRRELLDLVVEFGYVDGARRAGVSPASLHRYAKAFGALEEIRSARGRMRRSDVREAARLLDCSLSTVDNMRRDGRLPMAFTLDDVRDYQRRRLALVPAADLAAFDWRWHACEVCGRFFRDGRSRRNRQTCSYECRDIRRRGLQVLIWKPRRRPSKPRVFIAGSCGTCGDAFVSQRRSAFCSEWCQRKAAKRRRKALERGMLVVENVSTEQLLKRDRYRCQICGGKVDPDLHKTSPRHSRAASKDHIQPASFGGVESYDNTRLAHYGCNSARGNRDEFQFRLPIAA